MTRSYLDIREVLAGDIRRGAVALEEGAIARYLASRAGAGLDPSSAREAASMFMEDIQAGVARESAMASGQHQRSRDSDRRPGGATRR